MMFGIQQLAATADIAEPSRVITGSQIRAAMGALGLSPAGVANLGRISESTVRRAAAVDGIPKMRTENLFIIQRALEAAGIIFIDAGQSSPSGGAGVRLKGQ